MYPTNHIVEQSNIPILNFHRYADLIGKAQERHANLEESMKKNAMLREAKEIESWMMDCVRIKISNSLIRISREMEFCSNYREKFE